jgi:glutamine synthetase type III
MLFADELEATGAHNGQADFDKRVAAIIKRELTAHRRIIFDGNGYDESWLAEAKRRGLSNLSTAVDALPAYIAEKNISGIERELHEAALGITSIEHRRNTELERVRANYLLAEESFSKSLDTLKCTKN